MVLKLRTLLPKGMDRLLYCYDKGRSEHTAGTWISVQNDLFVQIPSMPLVCSSYY